MRSLIGMPSHRAYLAAPAFIVRTALAMSAFMQLASAVREFISPLYRPELNYMRGAGPACARRAIMVESKQVLPVPRGECRAVGRCCRVSPVQRQPSRKAP
ncbi:hypothetical protein FJ423_16210 [Mesorhizobium sp. B2-8-9]|nr:hypothetical protein FJ423_16210 [Mesorhizobium sp. B2-8-9]